MLAIHPSVPGSSFVPGGIVPGVLPGVLRGVVLALVCLAPFCAAQKLALHGVTDSFDTLYPSRTKTFIKASADPDDRPGSAYQGNNDGFSGLNGCEAYRSLVSGVDHAVLAHIAGRPGFMGCFFRNYWSDLAGVPQITLEENAAQILVDKVLLHDQALPDYYRSVSHASGQKAPFDGVFTGGRAGGHLTHSTIPWQDEFIVRVTENSFNNAARFHKVCGTLYDPDEPIVPPSNSIWGEAAKLSMVGKWPHKTARVPTVQVLNLPASGSATVNLQGPATILELTCKIDKPSLFNEIEAVFTWDSQAQPSVVVPLRLLGGMVQKPFSFAHRGVLHGNNGNDELTCYFPMHFEHNARLEFRNSSAQPVQLTLTQAVGLGQHTNAWGYFTAFYNAGVTQFGKTFQGPIIESGHGMLRMIALESYVDLPIFVAGNVDLQHLEGDLMVRINGNRGDDHTFAASETSIGKWGWYGSPVDVPFSSQGSWNSSMLVHGWGTLDLALDRMMGSTFIFDPIHFADGIEIRLEHGVQNTKNAHYGMFTVFYVDPGSSRQTVMSLDVGDVAAEAKAGVAFQEKKNYSLTSGFFRDDFFGTPALTTSTVREIASHYRFTVSLGDGGNWPSFVNFGLGCRLDRDKVGTGGICQAEVFVDGKYAGLLHSFTSNMFTRWKEGGELEVELPAILTRGKRSFTVELRPRATTEPFNLAGIEVYGYTK